MEIGFSMSQLARNTLKGVASHQTWAQRVGVVEGTEGNRRMPLNFWGMLHGKPPSGSLTTDLSFQPTLKKASSIEHDPLERERERELDSLWWAFWRRENEGAQQHGRKCFCSFLRCAVGQGVEPAVKSGSGLLFSWCPLFGTPHFFGRDTSAGSSMVDLFTGPLFF